MMILRERVGVVDFVLFYPPTHPSSNVAGVELLQIRTRGTTKINTFGGDACVTVPLSVSSLYLCSLLYVSLMQVVKCLFTISELIGS